MSNIFKLLVIGESGVGKTCLIMRFADNTFSEQYLSTIGVDFKVKEITVDDQKVKLQIWDSAGQDRFKNITSSYYKNSNGIIVVYDITRRETYEKAAQWIEDVRAKTAETGGMQLMLVGNKSDLEEERAIPAEEGREFAHKNQMIFMEASAKSADGVEDSFNQIAHQLLLEGNKPSQNAAKTINVNQKDDTSGGCCNVQ